MSNALKITKAEFSTAKNLVWIVEVDGRRFDAHADRVYHNARPGWSGQGKSVFHHVHIYERPAAGAPGTLIASFTAYSAPKAKSMAAIEAYLANPSIR